MTMNNRPKAITISIDSKDLKSRKFLVKFIGILFGLGLLLFTAGYFAGKLLYQYTH